MVQLRNYKLESTHVQSGLQILGTGSEMCLPEEEYFPAADLSSPLRISIWKGYQWDLQMMKDKEISWKPVSVWKPCV